MNLQSHCGASAKDAGSRITTITKLDDSGVYSTLISSLAASSVLALK